MYRKALTVAALSVAVIAASRRIPQTRGLIIPGAEPSFFSFLPFID